MLLLRRARARGRGVRLQRVALLPLLRPRRHLQGARQGRAPEAAAGRQGQILHQARGEEDQGRRRRVHPGCVELR